MAVLPTRLLEVEFDAGVWTDVTADFVVLSTRRGRNRESGAFETGEMTFTLRNDARKYDPDNTAGPYYGKLRPNRRVRFRATYAAVTYPIFLGYIDRISQVYGGPNDAVAEFQVSDFFKLLNRVELPVSVYATETAADTPVALWALDEPAGSTTLMDAVGSRHLTVNGAPTLGAEGLIVRDPGSAMQVNANPDGAIYNGVGAFPVTGAPFSVEMVWQQPAGPTDGFLFGMLAGPFCGLVLYTNGAGVFEAQLYRSSTDFTMPRTTGVNINDGAVHHLAFVWRADGTIGLYVDGIDRADPGYVFTPFLSAAAPFPNTNGLLWVGGAISTGYTYNAAEGVYERVAIYNTALSTVRVAAHNTAARTPWNGDLPGTRLGRIFDLAAVPAGDRNIDAGTTTLQATDLGGTALGYAQKVEETELGWLFVARDGKLRFIGRNAGVTGAYLTSLATLVDDDSGAGLPYRASGADVDEALIVTRATTSREGSVAVTVYDAAAKAEFGWLDETHDGLLHDSDPYSRSYSEWVLNTHKAPTTRIGTVELELTKDPAALYPAILALELADKATYKKKPQNVGTVFSLDGRVEAISHETGPHYWRTRLQLSPFNLANNLPVFVWDVTRWDQHVWGI
jgi:hypothetical protein